MCTRATYLGPGDTVITARTFDWVAPVATGMWVFPAGMPRHGAAGPDSLAWTAACGSVVISGFDGASVEGMNERGLVVNMLYLAESDYGARTPGDRRKPISIAAWGQYVLDRFATVVEAVEALRQEPFIPVSVMTPDGHPGTAHLSLTDPSGDSAILEYVGGQLQVHHGRQYQVMTNSPTYDQQLALDAYWEQVGGAVMLPGTSRAADRFVRASYYVKHIPQTAETAKAVAGAFGVIRNTSVPFGISSPGEPNIAATRWRSVFDQKNRVYYYESAESPSILWLDFADLDFSAGAPILRLAMNEDAVLVADGEFVSGNAARWLRPAEPFAFIPATPASA